MWMFILQYRKRFLTMTMILIVGIGAFIGGRSSVQTEEAVGVYKMNEQVAIMLGEETASVSPKLAKDELVEAKVAPINKVGEQSASIAEAATESPSIAAVSKEAERQIEPSSSVAPLTPTARADAAASGVVAGLIDLNTASLAQLMELPRIGETKAAAIIAYREQNGGFKSPEEIVNVKGIGDKTYESFKDQVTVIR